MTSRRKTVWLLVAVVVVLSVGAAVVAGVALLTRGSGSGRRSPMAFGGGGSQYLDLSLQAPLPEQPSEDLATLLGNDPPRTLRLVVLGLDRAASDPSVKGVLLRPGSLPDSGWGKVQELRDALVRFRKSGKPAYAYLETAGNKEYYLATACDKIFATPSAILAVTGLQTEVSFFAGSLEKLGIEAQFEGVGKYKNAPNQFTERGFTEPHREQMEALLDGLYGQFRQAIAESRKRSLEEVQELIDAGPFDAKTALTTGLVDELAYLDEVVAHFDGATRTTPVRYAKGGHGFALGAKPKIALIYAVGEIASGPSSQGGMGGDVAGSDTLVAALRAAREDDSVRALVLRVDSPGGSGVASDVVWRELRRTAEKKPVVASMGDMAASGGYYLAMGADVIVSQPGTITGSIGVFGGKFSLHGLYDKLGISKEILSRGRHAGLFSDYRPWDASERAHIHGLMASFYDDFIGKVAERRGKTKEEIDAVAQGRVWTGSEAKRHGLVDQLGGLDVALAEARRRAGIAADQEVALVVLPEPRGLWDVLTARPDELTEARLLPADARVLLNWARIAPQGPWARLPFHLAVR